MPLTISSDAVAARLDSTATLHTFKLRANVGKVNLR